MKKYVLTLCALLSLVSCSDPHHESFQQWTQQNGKVKVLSTIAMIDDLVTRIGGEQIDTLVLIRGELDPHSYQLVKGDDEKFARADIIFYNGLGLEHGPSLRRHLEGEEKAIAVGNKITAADPSLLIYEEGQLDPHIWMDISLWAKTVPHIVTALSEADPENRNLFEERGQELQEEMMQAHKTAKERLQAIPAKKRFLVTSHDAFNYFTRAYLATNDETTKEQWGKRFAAPEGLAPDSQLSTADIQEVIDHLKTYHIKILFPECNVSKDSIKKIVTAGQELGLQVRAAEECLYADSMGEGNTYLDMVGTNIDIIIKYWTADGSS